MPCNPFESEEIAFCLKLTGRGDGGGGGGGGYSTITYLI